MANKNIEQFIATYGPVAQQVSKEINVDPNVLLSQWGSESRWGQTDMAKKHHNLGGIKDFSGSGFEAKDNKTGSIDKYVKFEDPEVFGMYYTDQIKRNFPGAINTGPDIGAFTRGLATGKNGSYFGVTAEEYENSLTAAQSSIPENKILPFAPVAPAAPPKQAALPAAPPVENDQQRDARIQATIQAAMDEQEKRQAQLMGGGVGLGISGTKAVGAGAGAAVQAVANRAGQGFNAGMQRGTPPSLLTPPTGVLSPPSGPPQSVVRLPIPSGGLDAGRLAPGQTGTMPYNYAKAAGLTDIEAGRALDMTKQAGGVHDLTSQRREGMNKIQQLFPGERYVENPRFGGLLTPDQGVGGGPRASYVYQGASELPPGHMAGPAAPPPAGSLVQLPPRQPIPTVPKFSGLDAVTDIFKKMMQPVSAAFSTVGKYVLPPLALASAAGEGVNIAQQARRPEDQRDNTSMALSGANILGSGLSMFPATAPIGVPLMLGTGAAQAYRDNPEVQAYIRKKIQGLSNTPVLDEMTGALP
jgi:flagellar protein FlgJ